MSLHQLLDDPTAADPSTARLWALATVAREFHVLPSIAARHLDRDPERVDLVCAEMLQYAQAKLAYESAKDHKARDELVQRSRLASTVEENVFALVKERRGHR